MALDDGTVVGFAAVTYVHPDKPRPDSGSNEWAWHHHRRGIGRHLLAALLDVGRRERCSKAWVLADRSNTGRSSSTRRSAASGPRRRHVYVSL